LSSSTRNQSVSSVTIPNISPRQNTPDFPNIRRVETLPSGANCSRKNSVKPSLATTLRYLFRFQISTSSSHLPATCFQMTTYLPVSVTHFFFGAGASTVTRPISRAVSGPT